MAVRDALEGLDVEIAEGKSSTGLLVTLRGASSGRTVLLRGDMDALPMPEDTGLEYSSEIPGRMHACGHDSHTAMLAMAVHLLHQNRERLRGTVKFMFQAGEEGYFGARHMIEDGLLDAAPTPQAAFAIHVWPNTPTGVVATRAGAFMASSDEVRITVRGRGGHASVPHLSRDPIPAACEIVQALQSFVSRRINVFDPAVLSIASVTAGSTHNVIPESVQLTGTLRAVSPQTLEQTRAAIERISTNIAAAHELAAEVVIKHGYPVTLNDAAHVEACRDVVRDLFGADAFQDMSEPLMTSEDFSFVLQRARGCMVFLGAAPDGTDASHAHACHSNRMLIDEPTMARGIALHAAIAERYLDGC